MKVFWLHYMNCWKVLTTPPYNFHTLALQFLIQIKTHFTQQFSKAREHFSFFLQTCFWDNLFVLIYFWRHLICLGKSPLVMLSRTNTLPCVLHCCRSISTWFFYTTFNVSIGSSRTSPRTLFPHLRHMDYIVHCVSVLPKSPPCCVCVSRSPWQIPPCCLLVQTELPLLLMLFVLYLTRYEDMTRSPLIWNNSWS